jgi:hypothetical protein
MLHRVGAGADLDDGSDGDSGDESSACVDDPLVSALAKRASNGWHFLSVAAFQTKVRLTWHLAHHPLDLQMLLVGGGGRNVGVGSASLAGTDTIVPKLSIKIAILSSVSAIGIVLTCANIFLAEVGARAAR